MKILLLIIGFLSMINWNDILFWIITPATGIITFFVGKWQTKRERKRSDFQMINEAISPLITSIGQLTEQNNELVQKLMNEQDKNLKLLAEKSAWIEEREELNQKIDKLQRTVNTLSKKIDQMREGKVNES